MASVVLVAAVFWLAYSNGANDNFKGVATLYGSSTSSFRGSLMLATVATAAGSLVSLMLASSLAISFSGKGLIAADLAGSESVLVSVAGAGAVTVLLATLLGMPTSTTHALTGALLGVAVVGGGAGSATGALWGSFFAPLLVSPVLAVLGAGAVYPVLRAARRALGVSRESCICVGSMPARVVADASGGAIAGGQYADRSLRVAVGPQHECVVRYQGRVVGVDAQTAVNSVHYVSAAAVCFARAVNDTPKIAALLLAGGMVGSVSWNLGLVAAAMAMGGLLSARRVAETMGKRITTLNSGQGLTGNAVTAVLVLGASHLGMPVSTTHVSCGSLFGIGCVTGEARWKTVVAILATWGTTLPCGALLGGGAFWMLTHFGGM